MAQTAFPHHDFVFADGGRAVRVDNTIGTRVSETLAGLNIHVTCQAFDACRYSFAGESNYRQPGPYACSFPAMIHDWRAKFASPRLPFYFVQLAPCYGHK